MKKRTYKTPSTNTITLCQQVSLLQSSGGVNSTRDSYGDAETGVWGE